ncbi:hypothetical protein [Cognaticolwellia aestuarii]|uniref:hypothetical protein n=1 Tax=Cognaticolwellia aestuarii TaxID=329993 RepID=UPI0009879D2F|nr:hypothetical protein [Cognaticolwellia aestuarii]
MVEHGTYTVELEGSMIKVTLIGMFNDLATQAVCLQIEALVDSFNGQGFGLLFDCTAYEGSTPDAHKVSNQHILWLNRQNCLARAMAYNHKIQVEIVKNAQPAVLQLKNRQEFYNLQDARNWLLTQL